LGSCVCTVALLLARSLGLVLRHCQQCSWPADCSTPARATQDRSADAAASMCLILALPAYVSSLSRSRLTCRKFTPVTHDSLTSVGKLLQMLLLQQDAAPHTTATACDPTSLVTSRCTDGQVMQVSPHQACRQLRTRWCSCGTHQQQQALCAASAQRLGRSCWRLQAVPAPVAAAVVVSLLQG